MDVSVFILNGDLYDVTEGDSPGLDVLFCLWECKMCPSRLHVCNQKSLVFYRSKSDT